MTAPRPRTRQPKQLDAGILQAEISSFRLHLAAGNKSAKTIRTYTEAVQWFAAAHLLRRDSRDTWEQVDSHDIQQWMSWLLDRYSSAYASNQYRALQQFFKWLAAEDELPDPTAGLQPPPVPQQLGDPARSDLDLQAYEIRIAGKGGKPRTVRIGHQAARSLDRYLRARARHPQAWRPQLWLGEGSRGPLTPAGIYQIIARRGRQCGVTALRAPVPAPLQPHLARPRRRRTRPDGTQRLDLPPDAHPLRRQRPRRPRPPQLRPHHGRHPLTPAMARPAAPARAQRSAGPRELRGQRGQGMPGMDAGAPPRGHHPAAAPSSHTAETMPGGGSPANKALPDARRRPSDRDHGRSARPDCYAGGLGGGMQIVSSGRRRIIFGCGRVRQRDSGRCLARQVIWRSGPGRLPVRPVRRGW